MIKITSEIIVTPELEEGAIYNDEYIGFHLDYLVLHCLLKRYNPKTIFEIGTNMGTGTKIIANALGSNSKVYSLDLPTELAHISLQHPIQEGKGDKVGFNCNLPFTQLRGDSMNFDYSKYPCEAYYIDGEHDYNHPYHETKEVLKMEPKIIIYHDSDIECVYDAITDAFSGNTDYELIRVKDCRIAYAHKINN